MRTLPQFEPFILPALVDILIPTLRRWAVGALGLAIVGLILFAPIWLFYPRDPYSRGSIAVPKQSTPVNFDSLDFEGPVSGNPAHPIARGDSFSVQKTAVSQERIPDEKAESRRSD